MFLVILQKEIPLHGSYVELGPVFNKLQEAQQLMSQVYVSLDELEKNDAGAYTETN